MSLVKWQTGRWFGKTPSWGTARSVTSVITSVRLGAWLTNNTIDEDGDSLTLYGINNPTDSPTERRTACVITTSAATPTEMEPGTQSYWTGSGQNLSH